MVYICSQIEFLKICLEEKRRRKVHSRMSLHLAVAFDLAETIDELLIASEDLNLVNARARTIKCYYCGQCLRDLTKL